MKIGEDGRPRVYIDCFESPTTFVVDTRCPRTLVKRSQMKEWGEMGQLYEDEDRCFFEMEVGGTTFKVRCRVHSSHENLLGLDLLYRFNCVVDFTDLSLTFRHFANYQLECPKLLY